MSGKKNKNGFTIVELLIVIVVIAILAALSVVAYDGIQSRARDTKRAGDLVNIEKALKSYDTLHGGVPMTTVFGRGNGGWNYSTMTNWLTFLEAEFGKMPVDPINSLNGATYPTNELARAYFYYCYPDTSWIQPNSPTVRIGYVNERGVTVYRTFIAQNCLTSLP